MAPERRRWGIDVAFDVSHPRFVMDRVDDVLVDAPLLAIDAPRWDEAPISLAITLLPGVAQGVAEATASRLAEIPSHVGEMMVRLYDAGELDVDAAAPYRRGQFHMMALGGGTLSGRAAGRHAMFWCEGRYAVQWPPGFTATTPPLTLLNERGNEAARVGDEIRIGGGLMEGTFLAHRVWRVRDSLRD